MRRPLNLPDASIAAIGRELRLTGDLVYAGGFSPDAGSSGESSALFFARLFTSMVDDGSGVFVDPKTFNGSKIILDSRIYDDDGKTVGYVVEEFVEEVVSNTLFCGVMLRASGLSEVQRILKTSLLWPMISGVEARCSGCGRSYNYRTSFNWCDHILNDQKQLIVEAKIKRLVLTDKRIKQNPLAMFETPYGFADIALEPLDMDQIMRIEGEEGDPMITFAVSRDIGYDSVTVGEFTLSAGQRVAVPMSMVREVIDWELVASSMVVPIDHDGSIRSLFPRGSVPEAANEEQNDTRGAGN